MLITNNARISFDDFDGDKILLIDADGLVYGTAFACQKNYYEVKKGNKVVDSFKNMTEYKSKYADGLPEGYTLEKGIRLEEESKVRFSLDAQLKSLYRAFRPKEVRMYLQGKNNFREKIASIQKYKAGRSEKPHYFQMVRDYLVDRHGAKIINNWETDDQIVMEHYAEFKRAENISDSLEELKNNCKTIMMTRDKDLFMCPGWGYNLGHYDNEAVFVHPLGELFLEKKVGKEDKESVKVRFNGLKGFYFQSLVGDGVDAIPGIMSEKKAYDMLRDCTDEVELYQLTRNAYIKALGKEVIYYPWTEYVDPDAPKSQRLLKPGAKKMKVSIDEYMREVFTLLWMLREPFDKLENIRSWEVPCQV